MILPIEEEQADVDLSPQYDMFERIEAGFEATTDTFVENVLRNRYLEELEIAGRKAGPHFGLRPPEELNKLFKNVEKPFTKPTDYFAAQEMDQQAAERKKAMYRASNLGQIEQGFFSATTLGGMVKHMIDPAEAGLDLVFGLGIKELGLMANAANRFKNAKTIKALEGVSEKLKTGTFSKLNAEGSMASKISKALPEGSFRRAAAEGVATNLALEPYNYYSSQRAQMDYTTQDAIISVVGGGVFFPAVFTGLKKGVNFLHGKYEAQAVQFKTAVMDVMNDRLPNSGQVRQYFNKIYNNKSITDLNTLRGQYRFKRVSELSKINKQQFFMASKSKVDLDPTVRDHYSFDREFGGDVIHLTDDPNIAHNVAGNEYASKTGEVQVYDISAKNLIDGDVSMDTPHAKDIANTIEDPELRDIFLAAEDVKEGFSSVRDFLEQTNQPLKKLDEIHNKLEKQGYDGITYTMQKESGEANANGLVLYRNSDNRKHKASAKVNRAEVPKPTPKEVQQEILRQEDPKNEINYNDSLDQEMKKAVDNPVDTTEEAARKEAQEKMELIKENIEQFKNLEDLAPDKKAELEAFEMANKFDEDAQPIVDKYVKCLSVRGE
jgi:hypothetical protein